MPRPGPLTADATGSLAVGGLGPAELAVPPSPASVRPRRLLRRILANGNCVVGLSIVLAFVAAALLAPLLAPADPLDITGERLRTPSGAHLLGTDGLGRDILSRVLFGARVSLWYTAVAALLVMTIGAVVGTVAGYVGGLVDTVLMRLVDVILALPGLVLSLAIAGLFEASLTAVLFGLVSVWWVGYARIVRGLVLSVRERDYVEAARAMGSGGLRLVLRHVVPNVAPSILVLVTLRAGRLILAISGLSFLGLGAQPPTPEWGAMLNESRPYFPSYPHLMLAPGIAITMVVMGLNMLGDGLRDVIDPRLRARPGA